MTRNVMGRTGERETVATRDVLIELGAMSRLNGRIYPTPAEFCPPRPGARETGIRTSRLANQWYPTVIPLSKIHHAAFEAHLIGIDPDYRRRRFPDLRWG